MCVAQSQSRTSAIALATLVCHSGLSEAASAKPTFLFASSVPSPVLTPSGRGARVHATMGPLFSRSLYKQARIMYPLKIHYPLLEVSHATLGWAFPWPPARRPPPARCSPLTPLGGPSTGRAGARRRRRRGGGWFLSLNLIFRSSLCRFIARLVCRVPPKDPLPSFPFPLDATALPPSLPSFPVQCTDSFILLFAAESERGRFLVFILSRASELLRWRKGNGEVRLYFCSFQWRPVHTIVLPLYVKKLSSRVITSIAKQQWAAGWVRRTRTRMGLPRSS